MTWILSFRGFFRNEKISFLASGMIFLICEGFWIYLYFNRVKKILIFQLRFTKNKLDREKYMELRAPLDVILLVASQWRNLVRGFPRFARLLKILAFIRPKKALFCPKSHFLHLNWPKISFKIDIKNPYTRFLATIVLNMCTNFQIYISNGFLYPARFRSKNRFSGGPFKDFRALLKYTTDPEIGKFQIAITRARINIFGRDKKLLVP